MIDAGRDNRDLPRSDRPGTVREPVVARNDRIRGGPGKDTCKGGPGNDNIKGCEN